VEQARFMPFSEQSESPASQCCLLGLMALVLSVGLTAKLCALSGLPIALSQSGSQERDTYPELHSQWCEES
jgi:hypothetical protein